MTDSRSAAKASRAYAAISSELSQWDPYHDDDDDGFSGYVVSKRVSGRFSPPAQSSKQNKATKLMSQTPFLNRHENPGWNFTSDSKWIPIETPAKSPFLQQQPQQQRDNLFDNEKHKSQMEYISDIGFTQKTAQNISSISIPKFTTRPSLNNDYRPYYDALMSLLSRQEKRNNREINEEKHLEFVNSIMRSVYDQATVFKKQQNASNHINVIHQLEMEGHFWSLLGAFLKESPVAGEDFLLFFSNPTFDQVQRDIETFIQDVVRNHAALDPAALATLVQESLHFPNGTKDEYGMPSPPLISKRRQCILEWLQACHGHGIEVSTVESKKVMWKDSIQDIGKSRSSSLNNKKIDSIHPDAPFLVNDISPLFGNDNKVEVELLTICLTLLKAGRFSQALELCAEYGQPWRASVWNGNSAHGYAIIEKNENDMTVDDVEMKILVGNPQRALWKRTMWRASESMHSKLRKDGYGSSLQVSSGSLVIEAAISAVLADDFKTASTNPLLSTTWMDKLWLFYHCLQSRLMELIYHSHNNHKRSVAYADQFPYEGTSYLVEEKEQLLCTAGMSRIDEGSFLHGLQSSIEGNNFWFNGISAFLIGIEEVKRYLYGMGSQLVRFLDIFTEEYETQLRFMVHLLLLLESFCNVEIKEYSAFFSDAIAPYRNELILVYLRRLSSEKPLWEFFALYASLLPNDLMVDACTQFWFNKVFKDKDRRMVLKQARNCFDEGADLDILRHVVRTILNTTEDDESVNKYVPSWRALLPTCDDGLENDALEQSISSVDLFKLHSINWLTIYEEHYLEALICGNMLLRDLLLSVPDEVATNVNEQHLKSIADWSASSKLYAAKLLQSRILTPTMAEKFESGSLYSNNRYASSFLLEYHALSDFLRAHSAYENWSNYICSTKSSVEVTFYGDMAESSIESEVAFQTEVLKYAKRKREIAIGMFKAAETARGALVSVLEFHDVGWLKFPLRYDSEEDTKRNFQIEQLRKTCIPVVLSLVYQVLDETAQWMTEFHHEVFDKFGMQRGKEIYSRIEYDGGISYLESPFHPSMWYKSILSLANTVAASDFDISNCLHVEELNEFMNCMADASIHLLMLKEN